jgi:hypothetical protein
MYSPYSPISLQHAYVLTARGNSSAVSLARAGLLAYVLACVLLLMLFAEVRVPAHSGGSAPVGSAPVRVPGRSVGFAFQPWGCRGIPLPC